MNRTPRTITAIPAGRDRTGQPITRRRTYLIDRDPEDWGGNRSRIFSENRSMRHPGGRFIFTPWVVLTDSIQEVAR